VPRPRTEHKSVNARPLQTPPAFPTHNFETIQIPTGVAPGIHPSPASPYPPPSTLRPEALPNLARFDKSIRALNKAGETSQAVSLLGQNHGKPPDPRRTNPFPLPPLRWVADAPSYEAGHFQGAPMGTMPLKRPLVAPPARRKYACLREVPQWRESGPHGHCRTWSPRASPLSTPPYHARKAAFRFPHCPVFLSD